MDSDAAPENFDPRLVEVAFSFKVECPTDFDCKPKRVCREETRPAPDIDYLAKDYSGFRRLMLDRMSRLIPGWRERTPADLGVALVEVLAYAADQLSYWQDAVATEAYLETARRRTSLRRHALLVDYAVHEGCNARAWVQVQVNADAVKLEKGSARFYTKVPTAPPRIEPGSGEDAAALQQTPLVFEPAYNPDKYQPPIVLYQAHNEMRFYTWGDRRCCLPKGAVKATLAGHFPNLAAGDVLIFQEVKGPLTGEPEDADPTRRHAVRLTWVNFVNDSGPLVDTLTNVLITEIAWHSGDAMPFPLCISSVTDKEHGNRFIEDVSVALGNIVLADHGKTVTGKELGTVPASRLFYPPERDDSHCQRKERVPIPPRFRPRLAQGPLTRVGRVLKAEVKEGVATTVPLAFDPEAAANAAMTWDMAQVVAEIRLDSTYQNATERWEPRSTLLESDSTDTHFVVETEHDNTSYLRFGDDTHGKRPDPTTRFTANYRVGNGTVGTVGADSIVHAVTDDARIVAVTNPVAARGGTEPETTEQVRRRAPQAFRRQERAVTPADYAEVTQRLAGVQRAAAALRWTGSWHTVFVTVDREQGLPVEQDDHRKSVAQHLDRYRMAGHDLRIDDPVYVSLEIDMLVCLMPIYFRSEVKKALLEVLGSGMLPDGRRGVFHPDNWNFGQTVYLSPIYAAARSVPGVASVQITRFQRAGQDDPESLADGFMRLGGLEIPRLENDPNYPEHGVLRLELHGGK
jgi:hypothetical protein